MLRVQTASHALGILATYDICCGHHLRRFACSSGDYWTDATTFNAVWKLRSLGLSWQVVRVLSWAVQVQECEAALAAEEVASMQVLRANLELVERCIP